MGQILVGFVTAIVARDPSHAAPPIHVEIYAPAAPAGARTQRFHLEALCDTRELAMLSVLRDALVHHLTVRVDVGDDDRLNAVELNLPVRETYSEGGETHEIAGTVTWLEINEAVMGTTDRGQPDYVTVIMAGQPAMLLLLDRRNPDTKAAQLILLQEAHRQGQPLRVRFMDYPVSPGNVARVIVGVGVGTPPVQPVQPPMP